jgi:hypothetical protein
MVTLLMAWHIHCKMQVKRIREQARAKIGIKHGTYSGLEFS